MSDKLVKVQENALEIINLEGKNYQLKPLEKLEVPVKSLISMGKYELDEDSVYILNPKTRELEFENKNFEIPKDIANYPVEQRQLIMANYFSSLSVKSEKKLDTETFPRPIFNELKNRFIYSILLVIGTAVLLSVKVVTWHILIFLLLYLVYNALISYNVYKIGVERNFKVFSGVITNVFIKQPYSPSLKRGFIQISNGKKFLTFPYKVKHKSHFPIGTPVTLFLPNFLEITESEMGPLAKYYLAVSFSGDVKSSNSQGEYQDGTMQDIKTYEFFDD